MVYGDFKDLTRRTASDKILRNKVFNIAKNPKYGVAIKNEIMPNKELAEELHKPIIRTIEKRKVCSCFIDNIWGTDMQLISKFN